MAETINVKKLNKPLMHSNEYIYPITTDDQVIVGDKRLPAALTDKVNTSDVLSLEEIEASSDLTGKVASAESVNEVNSNLKWKLAGEIVGPHDIGYPSTANELFFSVFVDGDPQKTYEVFVPVEFIKHNQTGTVLRFHFGSSDTYGGTVYFSSSVACLGQVKWGSTDKASTSKSALYYR